MCVCVMEKCTGLDVCDIHCRGNAFAVSIAIDPSGLTVIYYAGTRHTMTVKTRTRLHSHRWDTTRGPLSIEAKVAAKKVVCESES